jgi:protein-disulfide isomerase
MTTTGPIRRLPAAPILQRRTFGVIAGQPIGVIWLVWFVALGTIAMVWPRLPEPLQESLPVLLYLCSTILLAGSLYLAFAMFTQRVLCIPCIGNVVATLIAFAMLTRLPGSSMARSLRAAPRDLLTIARRPLLFVAVMIVPIAAGAWALMSAHRTITPTSQQWSSRAAFLDWYAKQPRASAPSLRTKPVMLVEFQDYQCPPCRAMYFAHATVREKYAHADDRFAVVTKDFPLDPQCNEFVKAPIHPLACRAAAAVRLARRSGKGEQLERWLFAHQDGMTREGLDRAALEVGGVADLEESYRSQYAAIADDVRFARSLSVQGTPTLFLNGARLPPLSADFLDAAIDSELRKVQYSHR